MMDRPGGNDLPTTGALDDHPGAKTLTFAKVRLQISVPCRNQATSAQLDYLAALIVKLANAKKIRWETSPGVQIVVLPYMMLRLP